VNPCGSSFPCCAKGDYVGFCYTLVASLSAGNCKCVASPYLGGILTTQRILMEPVVIQRFLDVSDSPEITKAKTEIQIFPRTCNSISSHSLPRLAFNNDCRVVYARSFLEKSCADCRMLLHRRKSGNGGPSNYEIDSRA